MRLLVLLLLFGKDVLCEILPIVRNETFTDTNPDRVKVKLKMCLLQPDTGPCRGDITMYYFQPEIKNCSRFSWGGCQGNGNRFDTKQECLDSCLGQSNNHTISNQRPSWCSLTFDYGFCFGAIKRWYFDRQWKVCKETIYSGCGGNKNNFYNLAQCDSICRFNNGPKEIHEVTDGPDKEVHIYRRTTLSTTTIPRFIMT